MGCFVWVNFVLILVIIVMFFCKGVWKKFVMVFVVKLFGVGFNFLVKMRIWVCFWVMAIVCLMCFGLFFIIV